MGQPDRRHDPPHRFKTSCLKNRSRGTHPRGFGRERTYFRIVATRNGACIGHSRQRNAELENGIKTAYRMRTIRKVASSGRGMCKIDSRPTARERGRSVQQGRQIISRDRELGCWWRSVHAVAVWYVNV